MVLVLDAAETILYASPALERVLGYTPEELIVANTLEYVHSDDVERVARFLAVRLATPGIAPPIEVRFREAQGGFRLLEVVGTNLRGERPSRPAASVVTLGAAPPRMLLTIATTSPTFSAPSPVPSPDQSR